MLQKIGVRNGAPIYFSSITELAVIKMVPLCTAILF